MLQVKIIKEPAERMEGEINAFLRQLGSVPGVKVSLHDIKYNASELQHGKDTALIIYNQVRVQQPPAPTKP